MHVIGIVEDLVKSIQKEVKSRKDIKSIDKVYIQLGREMGVSEDSLNFWFQNLSKGTELEGVGLDITLVEGRKILIDALETN